MQISSIPAYSLGMRNLSVRNTETTTQEPVPTPTPAPEQKEMTSIYFTSKKDDNGRSMRNATMGVLLPLTMLTAGGGVLAGCDKDEFYVEASDTASAVANATANAEANATVIINHGGGCGHYHYGCGCGGKDTIYVPKVDTVYVDGGKDTIYVPQVDTVYVPRTDTLFTTKYDTVTITNTEYIHDTVTVEKWRDDYKRPLPLDTLTKHMVMFGIDSVDTAKNRNIIHYEYDRPWEYNQRLIANMSPLESSLYKDVLVHDVEIKDYKGNHLFYGKHIRRNVENPVVLNKKDGSQTVTNKGIFLELRKNIGDKKNVSVYDTEMDTRYFLQTQGDVVKAYKYVGNNEYEEQGQIGTGYLGKNTILLENMIGEYETDDHLTDVVVKAVDDETLKEIYVRERDAYEAGEGGETRAPKKSPTRANTDFDPNAFENVKRTAKFAK